MEFLAWHYTYGINYYVRRYVFLLRWTEHYFSLSLIPRTLLSPWKRLVDVEHSSGFNLERAFQQWSFNLISRGMGAFVRIFIFLAGSVFLLFVAVSGLFGLILWTGIPFLSYGVYDRYKNAIPRQLERILEESQKKHITILEAVFKDKSGKFIAEHLGITPEKLLGAADRDVSMGKEVTDFKSLGELLSDSWQDPNLRSLGITKKDFIWAAYWWDTMWLNADSPDVDPKLGRPGLGLDLLYGYTPTLSSLSVDLGQPQSFGHRLIGREGLVQRMERALSGDFSVLLEGKPGVGKKTIVLEFARRAAEGELGSKMSYKKVLEFDHNTLLSDSVDVNQKKLKLAQALAEASSAGNVILVVNDLHRLTNKSIDGFDFTDIFEEYLDKKTLKIIAIASEVDYERFLSQNMRLRKYFEVVEAEAVGLEEAQKILIEAAKEWERRSRFTITVQALTKIIDASDRFISEVPFPEKAIELLDAAISYKEQVGEDRLINVDDINRVLSERTGVSFDALGSSEKKKLGNLEAIIHENLVNQEAAVNLIGKILRSKAIGAERKDRPLGSMLFLGPTGVGKTQTAKVLSEVYFGSRERILRFDMAEYAGREGLERLIGTRSTNDPGVLTNAIKNSPASLLLLDEIEKAPREIFNLFLALLDEGVITDAFGRKINCQNLFVIATSNAGSSFIRELVQNGEQGEEMQKKVIDKVIKDQIFSPELINRFDGTIVFEPLTKEHLVKIAALLFKELAVNLKEKGIYLETDEQVWQKLAEEGYQPEFGARPMRRIIELTIGDILGRAVLEEKIKEGDRILLLPGSGENEYTWRIL